MWIFLKAVFAKVSFIRATGCSFYFIFFYKINLNSCRLQFIIPADMLCIDIIRIHFLYLSLTSNPLLSPLYWTTSMKLPASVSSKYAESLSVWICSLEHRLLEEWRGTQREKKEGDDDLKKGWRNWDISCHVVKLLQASSHFLSETTSNRPKLWKSQVAQKHRKPKPKSNHDPLRVSTQTE